MPGQDSDRLGDSPNKDCNIVETFWSETQYETFCPLLQCMADRETKH